MGRHKDQRSKTKFPILRKAYFCAGKRQWTEKKNKMKW